MPAATTAFGRDFFAIDAARTALLVIDLQNGFDGFFGRVLTTGELLLELEQSLAGRA